MKGETNEFKRLNIERSKTVMIYKTTTNSDVNPWVLPNKSLIISKIDWSLLTTFICCI